MADGILHQVVGPEIVAVGSDPRLRQEAFSEEIVLPCPTSSRPGSEPPDVGNGFEELRESRFGKFRRLLAAYVLFWAMGRRVAALPLIGFDCWRSQSRT